MIVNSHPAVHATIELLSGLRQALRDFAAREEALLSDRKARLGRIEKDFARALEESEARLAAETVAIEEADTAARAVLTARHASRVQRIQDARERQLARRRKEADEVENRARFESQRDTLRWSRGLEGGLKDLTTDLGTFQGHLADADAHLVELENRARGALRSFGLFRRLMAAPADAARGAAKGDHQAMLTRIQSLLESAAADLDRLLGSPFVRFFRICPLWLLVAVTAGVPLGLAFSGLVPLTRRDGVVVSAVLAVLSIALHAVGRSRTGPAIGKIAGALREARALDEAAAAGAVAWREGESARLTFETEARLDGLDKMWNEAKSTADRLRNEWTARLGAQAARAARRNDETRRRRSERLEAEHRQRLDAVQAEAAGRRSAAEAARAARLAEVETRHASLWQEMESDWRQATGPVFETFEAARAFADKRFPEWSVEGVERWAPAGAFCPSIRFGRIEVDPVRMAGTAPRDPRLRLPVEGRWTVPLFLTLPAEASLLFETGDSGRADLTAAFNNVVLRILANEPPGRVQFTIIDPVELGQNFAGLMHLADFEEAVISSRIWTQTAQIEERLADLNAHIEKVTQMYLRNEFANITQYNEQAGRIAEKYHFLVVADFPAGFSELAVRRLLSIAAGGARCGVYLLMHWDQRRPVPPELVADDLRKAAISVRSQSAGFVLSGAPAEGVTLRLDAPPAPELATTLLQKIGRSSVDSSRVEMPFEEIAPPAGAEWSVETGVELRVPVGRMGASRQQFLALGRGTRQHVLIAGKTGSGKSTLLHVLVTNLALWCSPAEVEFYLIDFKKGVEFKCYGTHRLPHARVVAIESDREFGLSVLQRVDEELRRRGDQFRQLGVQDLPAYRKAAGRALPRTLLVIDEFQEFFVEDDPVSQGAALLLDRIVRQGRAFGIHVILGSQTLGGAYTLARATLGQMVVRIALQCNEADAHLIMDESNPAPRLLSRPGEAIYNDAAGAVEGNSPFQVVWLPEEVRDERLRAVRERADRTAGAPEGPIVFEGNAPSDVAENRLLQGWLASGAVETSGEATAFLGAPNSIKGPTAAVLRRQGGNHLLFVGQRDEAILACMTVAMVSLAAGLPAGRGRFVLVDAAPQGTPEREWIEFLAKTLGPDLSLVGNAGLGQTIGELAAEIERRADAEVAAVAPSIFLFVRDLQRFKAMRYEEDFGFSSDPGAPPRVSAQFETLLHEGPGVGIHVVCSCDTLGNLNRFLSRKALAEFEMRVLFQMSANDSASLIDSSKASQLGLHRALFHNAQQGHLETFRPYSLPARGWMEEAGRRLQRLRAARPDRNPGPTA